MKVELENLCNGAAVERFNHVLQQIIEDIRDPNTDPNAARTLTMTLKVKPQGDSREAVVMSLDVKSKLGGLRKVAAAAILDAGGAYTADPRQTEIPGIEPDITPTKRSGTDA